MSIKSKNNLIIKSKIIFRPPEGWDLFKINQLIINAIESEGILFYENLPSVFSASFVLKFGNFSIFKATPTNWEKFVGFLFRFLPQKSGNSKNAEYLAYKRILNSRIEETPFEIIITLNPKNENNISFFDCKIEIYPVIYQRVCQGYRSLSSINDENFMLQMLSTHTETINRFASQIGGKIIERPQYDEIRSMHQIFISHCQKDGDLKDFINRSFATTNISAVYEEYEQLMLGKISNEKVTSDIKESIAIFVLLSENVNNLSTTRDWVAFESGFGAALKKDVLVFEPIGARDKFSFVTPGLTDYLPFHLNEDTFQKYFTKIIKSYDYIYIPKDKPVGFPYKCKICQSIYKIHCPEEYSFPKNSLKCPVCNQPIKTEITPLSK